MTRPSVAHICEPVTGGLARHLELLTRVIPPRGFDLHLIVSLERDAGYGETLKKYEASGIDCHVVPMKRSITPLSDISCCWRIGNILREIKPDIVHTHSSKAGFLGRRAASILEIPCVHTPHVFAFEWAGILSGIFYRSAERAAATWCDRLILLSNAQQEIAFNAGLMPLEKMEVITNGIDITEYKPSTPELRTAARAQFGYSAEDRVVGMAARFEKQKGVGDFLRAAKALHEKMPEVKFLLAGEGNLEGVFQAQAGSLGLNETVSFCGNVKHMPPFYHALDCFVLASLWEGCPYVILEAQACEIPVVASNTWGSESIIENGETGILVPKTSEKALSDAIEKVLTDGKFARHIASWGRAKIKQNHSLDKWADSVISLYKRLLKPTG